MEEDGVLKVAYVQRIKRTNGRVDLYFRKGDYREGPLASPDGSEALRAEVQAILDRLGGEGSRAPLAGTVGAMLTAYNRSDEFLVLAGSTQNSYQDLIDELTEDCGEVLLSEVNKAWLTDLRSAWAPRGYRAANLRMQVLKNALAPIIDDEDDQRIKGDPFHKLKKVRRPHDAGEANPMWEDAEVDAAIEFALERDRDGLARAIALGRYGGFRRGTICALPRHARTIGFDDEGDQHQRLHWVTEKRKVMCDKPEDQRLTAIINRTANRALTVAYNAEGEPWKPRQLNQALDRLMTRLAKDGKVRAAVDEEGNTYCPLTIHGLRHARGVELAMAGASDAEIMSQLEHTSERAARIYRRQANRRRLADAGQAKINTVIDLRKRRRLREENAS